MLVRDKPVTFPFAELPIHMEDFFFYFSIGWEHIITPDALDHILFIAVLAAIYILKDWKQVLILVTAFTAGHTITLFLSARDLLNVNTSVIEFLIPCTIAITAITNLFQKSFSPKTVRINYFLALFFGLIHGLAFATTLRMILATNQSFALSMFSFSLGLETGQLLVVVFILVLSQVLTGSFKIDRRHWVIFLSAAVLSLSVQMAITRWPWLKGDRNLAFPSSQRQTDLCKTTFLLTGNVTLMKQQWRRSVQKHNLGEAETKSYLNKIHIPGNNL